MLCRIVVVSAIAAGLGACATETRWFIVEDVCASYGLRTDSPEYRKCQAREGRAGPNYTPEQLMTASRGACSSYGIAAYTQQYERCVRNEYAARAQG
jgi:hypothetical protein